MGNYSQDWSLLPTVAWLAVRVGNRARGSYMYPRFPA